MAKERTPLNKWRSGNNRRALFTPALEARLFRRPFGQATIARSEFFDDPVVPPASSVAVLSYYYRQRRTR